MRMSELIDRSADKHSIKRPFAELAVVSLRYAQGGYPKGTKGTVVDVLGGGAAYAVEFTAPASVITVRYENLI